METKSIAPRLVAAAKAIGFGIPKDGHIKGMYDYTSSAGTLRRVGPALTDQGIATTIRLELEPQSTVDSVMLKVYVTYHADGCEPLTTEGYGVGKASGGRDEKALLKAQSSAIKYAHILAFSLAMGFDPEEDDAQPQPAPINVEALVKAIDKIGDTDRLRKAESHVEDVIARVEEQDKARLVAAIERAHKRVKEGVK